MRKETLNAIKEIYGGSEVPAAAVDSELKVLWSNDAFEKSRLVDFRGRLDAALARLAEPSGEGSGDCGFFSLPSYPLADGTLAVTRCEDTYILALHGWPRSLDTGFYIGAAERFEASVRSAVDTLALSADAAQRATDSDDPAVEEMFDSIRRGAYRTLRSASEVSLFARYVNGGIPREGETVCDLGELALRLCEGARNVCRDASIIVDVPDAPVLVRAELRLAERALLAVISNALTYTRDGCEVRVSVTAGAGSAVVMVRDSGQGIKPEVLPHVCEPYYSRDPAADSDYAPSLGLGLAIASCFCAAHGGALAIRSEYGEGTTVAMSVSVWDARPGPQTLRAKLPNYVTDRYSSVYIELCELGDIPH